jgi:predicted AAA+ superfamily ATPase
MALLDYSEDQILERLRFENPWWKSLKIDDFYGNLRPRPYLELFWWLLAQPSVRRALVLMGPRRVGKTVMLFHTIQKLIQSGADPLKIVFFSIETPIYLGQNLDQLFKLARKATGKLDARGWCVLFDEIQYLKEWEVHLKRLVDDYPETRFIASGSAAAALRMKSNESGAGRFTDFLLPPLTFSEFIELKGLNHLILEATIQYGNSNRGYYQTNNIAELNRHFVDYINFGGYPEVTLSNAIASDIARYVRNDIIDKVLLRDLPSLYGIRDVQELNALFTMLAFNSGREMSLESLSQRSGVDKATLKKYIEYLEAAFLITRIRPVSETARRFERVKQFKVYLTNTSLRAALFSPISTEDSSFGHLVETAIFDQWLHRPERQLHYARWQKGEVDMVGVNAATMKPDWAVEVKWSNRFFEDPRQLSALLKFCKINDLSSALVTTIDKSGYQSIDGVNLTFTPASTYVYTVGKRVFQM